MAWTWPRGCLDELPSVAAGHAPGPGDADRRVVECGEERSDDIADRLERGVEQDRHRATAPSQAEVDRVGPAKARLGRQDRRPRQRSVARPGLLEERLDGERWGVGDHEQLPGDGRGMRRQAAQEAHQVLGVVIDDHHHRCVERGRLVEQAAEPRRWREARPAAPSSRWRCRPAPSPARGFGREAHRRHPSRDRLGQRPALRAAARTSGGTLPLTQPSVGRLAPATGRCGRSAGHRRRAPAGASRPPAGRSGAARPAAPPSRWLSTISSASAGVTAAYQTPSG